jgi:hypothetical protein
MIPPDVAMAMRTIPASSWPHACLLIDGGMLSLQATDGYIFVEVTWEDPIFDDIEYERRGFSRKDLEDIAEGLTVQGTTEFKFPDYAALENIWAKKQQMHTKDWGISPVKLMRVLQVFIDLGVSEQESIRMLMDGPLTPLTIDKNKVVGAFSIKAAIAAMRLD